jgi:secondary thiamine-phosphate synthase enzyme
VFSGNAQALDQLSIQTAGQGFTDITPKLNAFIAKSGIRTGLLSFHVKHTSCSLTINENADPRVLLDLAAWMDAIVPQDGAGPLAANGQRRRYLHDDEGNDDMPAHIRTALTHQTLSLSVENGQLLLGTWQAVYLWEHRSAPHRRTIACHLIGETRTNKKAVADTSTNLQRRNGEKLNELVQAKHIPEAWAEDGGVDTEVDLLIDRLHDIADDPR